MLKTLEGHRADFLAELPIRLATRRDRLRRAIALIEDNRIDLCDALVADERHPDADSAMQAEVVPALAALQNAARNVEGWMKPMSGAGLLDRLTRRSDYSEYQPIGVVGFAAPATEPIRQTAEMLAGALAAGNRVLVKLDQATPALGRLLEGLAPHYFDAVELTMLSGSPDADAAFAELPFDQSAGNESPARSPAIMSRSADFARSAEQLIAAKLVRAGRMPLAPDTLFVPVEHEKEIASSLWRAAMHFYPRMPEATEGAHFADAERARIAELIEDARARGAEIMVAEHPDGAASRRSMPLHIIRFATDDMRILHEDIRGPILPLRNYGAIDEAIGEIQRTPPAAISYFGRDAAERQQVIDNTLSSAIAIDGAAIGQMAASDLPAADSTGEESFRRFSRIRRVFRQPAAGIRGLGSKASRDQIAVPAPALQ